MIFAPGFFSSINSARSAVTKSPGTNSPVSSMKKQRSASPSKAAPRSALSSSTLPITNSRFSGRSGFGSWFGNVPSGSKKYGTGSIGIRSRTGGSIDAGHPVRRVDHDAQRLDRVEVDEGQHLLDEGRKDILLSDLSWDLVPGRGRRGHGSVADVQQARVAADRQRAAADDLHARVLLRVVRRGDLEPAVEPEIADREIEHLGADEPDVDHVGPGGRGALDRRLRHRRRRDAHVAPDGDPFRLELLDVGAPDRARAVLVDLVRDRCRGRRRP